MFSIHLIDKQKNELKILDIIHLRTFIEKVLLKREIRLEKRNIVNLLTNFNKDQNKIEEELNHINFVNRLARNIKQWSLDEDHESFIFNNFNEIDAIELMLKQIVEKTSERHFSDSILILMRIPGVVEFKNKFGDESGWIRAYNNTLTRLSALNETQMEDLSRIEEYFKIKINSKVAKAKQTLEFVKKESFNISTDNVPCHEVARRKCVKFQEELMQEKSYIAFCEITVVTEVDINSNYYNDLTIDIKFNIKI